MARNKKGLRRRREIEKRILQLRLEAPRYKALSLILYKRGYNPCELPWRYEHKISHFHISKSRNWRGCEVRWLYFDLGISGQLRHFLKDVRPPFNVFFFNFSRQISIQYFRICHNKLSSNNYSNFSPSSILIRFYETTLAEREPTTLLGLVATSCTTSFNIKISTLRPRSVFKCCVWMSEQTAIMYLCLVGFCK